jgi:hypothetical protein
VAYRAEVVYEDDFEVQVQAFEYHGPLLTDVPFDLI